MHASLKLGLGSHKQCTNRLLNFYYRKPVLFVVCSGEPTRHSRGPHGSPPSRC